MKTNTLTGADLNRAVAMALGRNVKHYRTWLQTVNEYWKGQDCSFAAPDEYRIMEPDDGTASLTIPDYVGDISVAWPIIKEHRIELRWIITDHTGAGYWQAASLLKDVYGYSHQDPQIAALRTFVASVYGDDIGLEQP